jgi:hypothetical protein
MSAVLPTPVAVTSRSAAIPGTTNHLFCFNKTYRNRARIFGYRKKNQNEYQTVLLILVTHLIVMHSIFTNEVYKPNLGGVRRCTVFDMQH